MTLICDHCGQAMPEWGGIALDDDRGEVRCNGYSAQLTRQEHQIVRFLLDKKGRVCTKDAIFDRLYQLADEDVEIKIIDVFVCKLRKKLKNTGITIGTAWGSGYYLEAPVNTEVTA